MWFFYVNTKGTISKVFKDTANADSPANFISS